MLAASKGGASRLMGRLLDKCLCILLGWWQHPASMLSPLGSVNDTL